MREKKAGKNTILIALLLVLLALLVPFLVQQVRIMRSDAAHGSAGDLSGRTIVVTIYGSDDQNQWTTSAEDLAAFDDVRKYLNLAGEYIEEEAARYGTEADFVTDTLENPDLCYEADFNVNLEDYGTFTEGVEADDAVIWDYIDDNIDVQSLKDEYDADNVVFLLAVNTDVSTKAITCTRNWYTGMERPWEIVYLYNIDSGQVNPPAVYAHEILHCFGAPDLYEADVAYNLTQSDVEILEEEIPDDIMLNCSDPETGLYRYDAVTNPITELSAWYLGLTDSSALAKELELTGNEHT